MSKANETSHKVEKRKIMIYGRSLKLTLSERREFDIGTFEKWESKSGMLFACFIKSDRPISEPDMIRIDLNRYEEPIKLGHDIFYFTEYWQGILPKKYINNPIRFVSLQPLQTNLVNLTCDDVIEKTPEKI